MKKYKTSFSNEELHKALHSRNDEAVSLINDEDKWMKFKDKALEFLKKAEKVPVLGGMLDDIECMICLADSYVKKEYQDIPVSSIISIVAALVYLVSPIDLIPDFIPVVGYLDDVAVVMFILDCGVGKDLDKYRQWNEKNRLSALSKLKIALVTEINQFIKKDYIAAIVFCNKKILKFILSDIKDPNEWEEYHIKELNIPSSMLSEYSVETEEDIQELLREVVQLDPLPWIDNADKNVYLETEFHGKWDKYIIRED